MKATRLALLAGIPVLLQLAGCAATKYEPQYPDSPLPDFTKVPICARQGGKLMHLEENKDCMVLVRSSDWLNRTPLIANEGESYAFSAAPDQFWYDATERITDLKGSPGHGIKNLASGWKRVEGADWFALIAATVIPDDKKPMTPDEEKTEFQRQDVGTTSTMQIKHAGQLAMYPNDSHGPSIAPRMFYKNNHGQIWVRVKRLANVAGNENRLDRQIQR